MVMSIFCAAGKSECADEAVLDALFFQDESLGSQIRVFAVGGHGYSVYLIYYLVSEMLPSFQFFASAHCGQCQDI